MSNFHYVLKAQTAGGGDEHPVMKRELTLGRRLENDVVLDDPKVSGSHAKLIFASETPMVVDLGSRNGTLLNGQPLPPNTPTPFQLGDAITVGRFSLSVRAATADAPAPPPVSQQIRISASPQPGIAVQHEHRLVKYPLEQASLTIGRAPDNAVAIQDSRISGRHARLERIGDEVRIVDLGSSNGVFYQGRRVASQTLQDGDVVYLSQSVRVQFRRHIGFQPAKAAPKKRQATQPAPMPTKSLDLRGQDVIKIGRAKDNDIVLDHPQVSRYHAMLERMGGRYRLSDLKSANGVFLNGERVEKESWPSEGDEIRVGPYRIAFAEDGIQQLTDQGLRLDVFGLQKWVRPDLNLLQEIYLSIYPQEFVALVGLSGAGKSTLMDAINGFRPATHGVVLVNGDNLYDNFDMYRNDMGYVPQRDIVHKELTIYDALDYAAQLRMPADTSAEERHRRVMEVIDELDLTARKDVPVHQLSGGQQKRVSIGVELLTKPRLFFLDEPTSGLDPGTEYKMMRLLRNLADQGRTIMLITHATKNVMLCDKVIIVVFGGYLAYYGPPEEALTYFDRYRTDEERRIKDMEFDDVYTILEDPERGNAQYWAEEYKKSRQYKEDVVDRLRETQQPAEETTSKMHASRAAMPGASAKRVSALRQWTILTARSFKIVIQDKKALAMMALMPIVLGVMDLIWGLDLFDPVDGDPSRAVMMLFVSAIVTMLAGSLSSVYEIVKEIEIYKRERAINLKILPYVMSKVTVGVMLSIYQAGVLLFFKILLVMRPGAIPSGDAAYIPFYLTLFAGALAGYLIGLAISASVPKPEQAMLVLIIVVVAQLIFSGALLPLKETPGHQIVSPLMSNRWVVDGLINLTGLGDLLVEDDCWDERDKDRADGRAGWNDILNESNDEKLARDCACMGSNIFDRCDTFPGILDPDFYTDDARVALSQDEPEQPPTPTPLPSPIPSPTPAPPPTATPEEVSPPGTLQECYASLEECQEKGQEQCSDYVDELEEQQEEYTDAREKQMEDYQDERQEQMEDYQDTLTSDDGWAGAKQTWAEDRQKAISSAEGVLKNMFESYDYAFQGEIYSRWAWVAGISLGLLALIMFFQKRKDVV
jgi:ABC transport system ATP-binding/permease protein